MSDLIVIEYRNKRVLTTNQLAESYAADTERVVKNFNRNKERYKEGKHFFLLEGQQLRDFRAKGQIDLPQNINKFYLWTEKGAWLHAKSLNTDEAWDAYELLVDEYYKVVEQQPQDPVELALQTSLENYREIKSIKTDVDYLKNSMRIDSLQQEEVQRKGRAVALTVLGGKESPAYNNRSLKTKVFTNFWNELKEYFKVPRYGDLPKSKFDEVLNFISVWQPSTSLKLEIESYNRQMDMPFEGGDTQ